MKIIKFFSKIKKSQIQILRINDLLNDNIKHTQSIIKQQVDSSPLKFVLLKIDKPIDD